MHDHPITRIRVDGARAMPKPGCVLVAGQLLAGELDGPKRIRVRSTSKDDVWRVANVLVGHGGPPNPYDLGEDGKRNLLFCPLKRFRTIAAGEEFTEVSQS
jgi:hypothetical protein